VKAFDRELLAPAFGIQEERVAAIDQDIAAFEAAFQERDGAVDRSAGGTIISTRRGFLSPLISASGESAATTFLPAAGPPMKALAFAESRSYPATRKP